MKLPKQYSWLANEDAPRHLLKAIELYGTEEIVGSKHNPVILGWAKEVGLQNVYRNDEIPWCGLFVAVIMRRAETPKSPRPLPPNPLWALDWLKFGVKVDEAKLGDVLIFTREGGGHVGIYVGETKNNYLVLGGNQGNKVSIVPIGKSRLKGIRRPAYYHQPDNVRKIVLSPDGTPSSTNEA